MSVHGWKLLQRAITKGKLKLELKRKVVWNTCYKELGSEIRSAHKKFSKIHFKTSKSHSHLEKLM